MKRAALMPVLHVALIAAFAAGLIALLAAAGNTADKPAQPQKSETRTRFSGLTSEVWRHGQPFTAKSLAPIPNNNPYPEPQPQRDRPERLALSADRSKLYVTLAGTEAQPGHEIAVLDTRARRVLKRIAVGARPYVPVLHPGGRFLVVVNELSNYASVIDTRKDEAVGIIPLDYYCQGLVFSKDGRTAYVANRYLDQVLVVDIEDTGSGLRGKVREIGGFDEQAFLGRNTLSAGMRAELRLRGLPDGEITKAAEKGAGGINAILRGRCGSCHQQAAGGFVAGSDPLENLLSAAENSIGGQPYLSPLLQAVIPTGMGGYGDQQNSHKSHPGGALFRQGDPDLERIARWIAEAENGPGIAVGNPMAHPKDLALSPDGRYLFVGNTGTMDVGIIDTRVNRQVGAVFTGNVASHVTVVPDAGGRHHQLVVLTMGAGFGAAKERDPHGAETWDRNHPAAQFTVLRDPQTTEPYPLEQQAVLGPYDAVDGTWNTKMRDIGNDLLAVDLGRLSVPDYRPDMQLDYQLMAHTYQANPQWVRYASDTAEATSGDMKGDIPPELQRVVGSFFEWAAVEGDRLFTSMAGSFEVVEWKVAPAAAPHARFEPVRVYRTGLRPMGIALTPDTLYVANQLGESVSIIDRKTGAMQEIVVGNRTRPPLDTDAEKGELVAHTTQFSSDNDNSCLHCHYRDTGDGRGWGAAETIGQDKQGRVVNGGTLGIPSMRNIYALQPYYFEGTHRLSEGQGADIAEQASSVDFDRPIWAGDFTAYNSPIPEQARKNRAEELKERVSVHKLGSMGYDLDERRNEFFRQQSMKLFGAAYDLKDLYRFVGSWLGSNTHLLPSPYDREHPSVKRGAAIFNDASAMCAVCHTPPEFTNKSEQLARNNTRALPQLTTGTRRDASYTLASVRAVEHANGETGFDMEPEDAGRVEYREGGFTTMQLRGLFDRPPVFLHHARTRSLREAIATPDHRGLRRFRLPVYMGLEQVRANRMEAGFNETTARNAAGGLNLADQILDTHGGTAHLRQRQLDDLVNFMLTID